VSPTVVERVTTPRGELVLRRDGEHFEVISNGTFLMDTRNGESERLLVRAALDRHPGPAAILIGGLGVGFSLVEALRDDRVEQVVVVEIEPALLDWHRTHLADISAGAMTDPRTELVVADIRDHLPTTADRYDVICLDTDNGPGWTVVDANRSLYGETGTAEIAARLTPHGVLSVWSAAAAPSYETLLRRRFARVETLAVEVPRGEPDVVVVAAGPNGASAGDH
jgi:spermidine synthase